MAKDETWMAKLDRKALLDMRRRWRKIAAQAEQTQQWGMIELARERLALCARLLKGECNGK